MNPSDARMRSTNAATSSECPATAARTTSAIMGWSGSRSGRIRNDRLAADGVEGGVVDGVDGAVRADEGGGVGLGARAVEVDLLGEAVPVQVPPGQGSGLAVHDHGVIGGVDHGRVDAPLIACSGGGARLVGGRQGGRGGARYPGVGVCVPLGAP